MPNRSADKPVERIVEQIHAKIVLGEYQPGDRLRQEVLAEEFNVSRTPIREALRLLEAKGIIVQEHRHSAVIRVPSTREVRETYRVRAELEALASELAAQWISDNQLEDLRTIHKRFIHSVQELNTQRTSSPKRTRDKTLLRASNSWIEMNAQFHSMIHVAGNNICLRNMISELNLGFTQNVMYSSARGMDSHRMQRNIDDHEKILHALERRKASEAREAMKLHVLEAGEFVISWLENHFLPNRVQQPNRDRGSGYVTSAGLHDRFEP